MTKVKICGITNLEDARHAIKSGADALGFNFYEPSPRYITPRTARDIIDKLDEAVLTVGVFVNEQIDNLVRIANEAALGSIQLHGDETTDYTRNVRLSSGLPVIKAFRVSSEFDIDEIDGYEIEAILIDSFSKQTYGGTGKIADWETAKKIVDGNKKVYLAGGLGIENVTDAIKAVRPYAVDACSLLEIRPGQKDHARVRAFIAAVRAEDRNS